MPGLGHLVVGMAAGRLHAPRDATTTAVAVTMAAYAVLWPLTTERYFAPWRLIPVAPILPTAWLSSWGARVVGVELLMFLPLLVYALWPRRGAPAPSPPRHG